MLIEQHIKEFVDVYTLALWALAFIVYTLSVRKLTAFNLIIFLAVAIHIAHSHIRSSVLPLFGNEEYEHVIDYWWFGSFFVTDVVYVSVSVYIVKRFNLIRDRASNFILASYGVLAFLQLFTLILRQFSIYSFDRYYSVSVVFINLLITIVPLVMVLRICVILSGKVKLMILERR